jgi:hypothetical protein
MTRIRPHLKDASHPKLLGMETEKEGFEAAPAISEISISQRTFWRLNSANCNSLILKNHSVVRVWCFET